MLSFLFCKAHIILNLFNIESLKEDLRAMSQWKITVQYEGHESKQRSKSHFYVIANLSFSSLEARQNNFIIAPKNNNKIKIIKKPQPHKMDCIKTKQESRSRPAHPKEQLL